MVTNHKRRLLGLTSGEEATLRLALDYIGNVTDDIGVRSSAAARRLLAKLDAAPVLGEKDIRVLVAHAQAGKAWENAAATCVLTGLRELFENATLTRDISTRDPACRDSSE